MALRHTKKKKTENKVAELFEKKKKRCAHARLQTNVEQHREANTPVYPNRKAKKEKKPPVAEISVKKTKRKSTHPHAHTLQ